uniref:Uncharacterized protein n=1 Tax=Timema monikensis TaxID=170555 RepID=A0A7R9DZF5_9NEOP|nr:unnamed protein product [Timema monikensis]
MASLVPTDSSQLTSDSQHLGKNTLNRPDRDSNPDLYVFSRSVYHESDVYAIWHRIGQSAGSPQCDISGLRGLMQVLAYTSSTRVSVEGLAQLGAKQCCQLRLQREIRTLPDGGCCGPPLEDHLFLPCLLATMMNVGHSADNTYIYEPPLCVVAMNHGRRQYIRELLPGLHPATNPPLLATVASTCVVVVVGWVARVVTDLL